MNAPSQPSQRAPRLWAFYTVVGAVLALAAYGAVMTATQRARAAHGTDGSTHAHPGAHTLPELRTSFGSMTVLEVERLGGLTSRDLAGNPHGVQSLVKAGSAKAEVSISITNRLGRPIAYSPWQYSLRLTRDGKPIRPQSSTLKPGNLPGGARIDARLGFVVRASASSFWLAFQDPARREPLLVRIGASLSSGTGSGPGSLNYDPLNGAKPDHHH